MCTTYNKEHQGNVNPWECVKLDSFNGAPEHPKFNLEPDRYQFAVAILEGKPVFAGDKVYSKTGELFDWSDPDCLRQINFPNIWTWTPPAPKRTFTLNGVELPCPVQNVYEHYTKRHFASLQFEFATADEGEEFMTKLRDILDKAMGS